MVPKPPFSWRKLSKVYERNQILEIWRIASSQALRKRDQPWPRPSLTKSNLFSELAMSQTQTINISDLDIAQLSEVRKQLEGVSPINPI